VELLVVIVVIAILAAITIIAYGGVTQKAVASSLQSDLSNAATALKVFEVDNGSYPSTISTNCSTTPDSPTNKCLKLTPGNIYIGYSANNTSSSKSFLLIASNKATTGSGSVAYKVTDSTAPAQLATTSQPGTTPGAVLELHAAKANGGTGPGINSPLTTTWSDTSGSGDNGTLTNFGTQTPWGGAGTTGDPYKLVFDGVDDYVVLPNLGVTSSGMFTYEAWARFSNTGYQTLLSEGNLSTLGAYTYLAVRDTGAINGGLLSDTGVSQSRSGTVNLCDGELHQFVAVFEPTTYRLYADGLLASADGGYSGSITTTGASVGVIRRSTSGFWYFTRAGISLARIYPYALTASQVAANYAAGPTW